MPAKATIGGSVIGLTGEERKRVLQARVRAYNARLRANPELTDCDCGRRAFLYKGSDGVCKRCDELESRAAREELWQLRLQSEAQYARGREPRVVRLEREETERDEALVPFEPEAVHEHPLGLVVIGHGAYSLLHEV